MAVAGFVVALLGFLLALFTLLRSERWHRGDSKDAREALRVATAAADSQARMAGREPWRVERNGDTGNGVRLTNQTGAAAVDVELSLTGPWVFWGTMKADPNRLAQQQTLLEPRIERGSSVLHQISLIDPPVVALSGWEPPPGDLRVTWSDGSGGRETWTWPVLSILPDGGVERFG